MLFLSDDRLLLGRVDDKVSSGYHVTGVFSFHVALDNMESVDLVELRKGDTLDAVSRLLRTACDQHRWVADQVAVREYSSVRFVEESTSLGYRYGYLCAIQPEDSTYRLRKGQLQAYEKHLLAIAQSLGKMKWRVGCRGHISYVRTKMLTTKELG